jgi:hypothetical protein
MSRQQFNVPTQCLVCALLQQGLCLWCSSAQLASVWCWYCVHCMRTEGWQLPQQGMPQAVDVEHAGVGSAQCLEQASGKPFNLSLHTLCGCIRLTDCCRGGLEGAIRRCRCRTGCGAQTVLTPHTHVDADGLTCHSTC